MNGVRNLRLSTSRNDMESWNRAVFLTLNAPEHPAPGPGSPWQRPSRSGRSSRSRPCFAALWLWGGRDGRTGLAARLLRRPRSPWASIRSTALLWYRPRPFAVPDRPHPGRARRRQLLPQRPRHVPRRGGPRPARPGHAATDGRGLLVLALAVPVAWAAPVPRRPLPARHARGRARWPVAGLLVVRAAPRLGRPQADARLDRAALSGVSSISIHRGLGPALMERCGLLAFPRPSAPPP